MFEVSNSVKDQLATGTVKVTRGVYYVRVSTSDVEPGRYEAHLNLQQPDGIRAAVSGDQSIAEDDDETRAHEIAFAEQGWR